MRPNIVIYISHDTGQYISPYGIDTVHTPHAERFAQQGVLFEDSFCTAPQCSPSRASLFTGCHPHTHGVMGLAGKRPHNGFDIKPDVRHLAARLGEVGTTARSSALPARAAPLSVRGSRRSCPRPRSWVRLTTGWTSGRTNAPSTCNCVLETHPLPLCGGG